MSKFRQAFDAEFKKATQTRQSEADAKDQAEKAERAGNEAVRSRLTSMLDGMISELQEEGVGYDLQPKLDGLLGDGHKYFMFQLSIPTQEQPGSVYRFSLSHRGGIIVHKCDTRRDFRNNDEFILETTIEKLSDQEIETVIQRAVRELAALAR